MVRNGSKRGLHQTVFLQNIVFCQLALLARMSVLLHPHISDLALAHYQSVSGIWKDGNRIVKILTHSGKGHQAHRRKRAYIGLLGIDL